MSNLEKLLLFLVDQYYDDKVYFSLAKLEGDVQVEVMFERNGTRNWTVYQEGDIAPMAMKTMDLVSHLEIRDVCLTQFETKVEQRALDMACYAYMQGQRVADILGEEAIAANLEDHKNFTQQLIDTLEELLGTKPKKPSLKLV